MEIRFTRVLLGMVCLLLVLPLVPSSAVSAHENVANVVYYDKDTGMICGYSWSWYASWGSWNDDAKEEIEEGLRREDPQYLDFFLDTEVIGDDLLLYSFRKSCETGELWNDFYYDLEENTVKPLTDEKREEFEEVINSWFKEQEGKINIRYRHPSDNLLFIDVFLGALPRWNLSNSPQLMTIETSSELLEANVSLENNYVVVKFSGPPGTSGHCYFTIEKNYISIEENFQVLFDNEPISHEFIETSQHYYVKVEYSHSSHVLSINGIGLRSSSYPSAIIEMGIVVAAGIGVILVAAYLIIHKRRSL